MCSDNKRLLDVRRLRRTGNENAECWFTKAQPIVSRVHMIEDLMRGYDQHQVLADEIQHAKRNLAIGDPDGRILRDGKVAGQDRDVDALEPDRSAGPEKGELA